MLSKSDAYILWEAYELLILGLQVNLKDARRKASDAIAAGNLVGRVDPERFADYILLHDLRDQRMLAHLVALQKALGLVCPDEPNE